MPFTGVQLHVQLGKPYEDCIKKHNYCCFLDMPCIFFSLCKLSFNSFIKNVSYYGGVLASVWLTHAPSSFLGCSSSDLLPSTCLTTSSSTCLLHFSSSSGCHSFLKDIWAEVLCAPLVEFFWGNGLLPLASEAALTAWHRTGHGLVPHSSFLEPSVIRPCPLCPVRATIPVQ